MGLLERLEKQKLPPSNNLSETPANQIPLQVDEYSGLKEKIHGEVIELINQELADKGKIEGNQKDYLLKSIENLVSSKADSVPRQDRPRLVKEIYNTVAGLGPLEPLLEDPEITEIMVNGPFSVYVERKGKLELTNTVFKDNTHVMNILERIVSSIGRRVDEASPMVDARLADGSRVNAIIPPLALNGPTITIRKFSKTPFTAGDLIRFNSMSHKMAAFLDACVKAKMNIIVSGGTGSGKTTLLNVLSSFIPNNERIVTIEDAAEIQLLQNHVVTLESRPPNLENAGQVTIRDLVRNALRMRPDRIIVGEVRSGETLDMLQAMNTGHDGSLTTAHANTPRDLMSRLETMVLMSGMEMPIKAIREQISSALNIVVQQSRMKDGSRKVVNISEVLGMEGDTIVLQDIYTYKAEGLDSNGMLKGSFHATGIRPTFAEKASEKGVVFKDEWFY